jgi:hypothetical protein
MLSWPRPEEVDGSNVEWSHGDDPIKDTPVVAPQPAATPEPTIPFLVAENQKRNEAAHLKKVQAKLARNEKLLAKAAKRFTNLAFPTAKTKSRHRGSSLTAYFFGANYATCRLQFLECTSSNLTLN